ncbi:MAG: SAM-dependent methyltransferase [Clostridiales bacterium]|nr:SAM-dependent methyltransferase [Clostridiales bacterium]
MLTKRLTKLISVLPHCDVLCDVGCDHGYVGIEALSRSIAKNVIFVDVSAKSLDKARQNCPEEYLPFAEFVCCDGLGSIVCDTAIIAGMGGLEIVSILNNAKFTPDQLVLQPMRNQKDVREYLTQNYEIISDEKFHDYKFYDLIVAKKHDKPTKLTDLELEFGKTNLKSPSQDFIDYLDAELTKTKNIPIFNGDATLQARATLLEQMLAEFSAKRRKN